MPTPENNESRHACGDKKYDLLKISIVKHAKRWFNVGKMCYALAS